MLLFCRLVYFNSLFCRWNDYFLLTGFLELINNILTTGQVPALFAEDEKDGIMGIIRAKAKEAGYGISK